MNNSEEYGTKTTRFKTSKFENKMKFLSKNRWSSSRQWGELLHKINAIAPISELIRNLQQIENDLKSK